MANTAEFRTCPDTGLLFHKPAETLMKLNAVAGIVFLLIGGVLGLLMGLTRWPTVHLLQADIVLHAADRARSQRADLLDHLLRNRGAVFHLQHPAALAAGDAALGLARFRAHGDRFRS